MNDMENMKIDPSMKPERIKKIEKMNEFLYNFTDFDNFQSKRFERYIAKARDNVGVYLNTIYSYYFLTDESIVTDLNTIIIDVFRAYFEGTDEESNLPHVINTFNKSSLPPILSIFNIFNKYSVDALEYNIDSQKMEIFNNKRMMSSIIDDEFIETSKDFIKRKALINENISEHNYFLTLPETNEDIVQFIHILFNRIYIDIERIIKSKITDEYLHVVSDNMILTLDKENETLKKDIEQLNKKISSLEYKNKSLQAKIDNNDKILKEKVNEINEDKSFLERQNNKLKNKYDDIVHKYNILKDSVDNPDIIEEVHKYKEVDLNLRYLFVISEEATFMNVISDTFKNATFVTESKSINENKIDMVISITTHIDHSTYYSIKNQCKTKNIPFLHCTFSNVDLIKETIWEYINNI